MVRAHHEFGHLNCVCKIDHSQIVPGNELLQSINGNRAELRIHIYLKNLAQKLFLKLLVSVQYNAFHKCS